MGGIATGHRKTSDPEFSLLEVVQTGVGAQTAYTMEIVSSFPGGGGKGHHSPPTNAEVKKTWVCTSTVPYSLGFR
jgi:hypothetical protein